MSLEPFQKSAALSLGVELEMQLVNTHDYDLAPYAEDMLRLMSKIPLPGAVVPEMTSSMIEVSTGVCQSSSEVLGQLTQIRDALVKSADKLNIAVVGGGTHPFQQWHERRIYDKPRFRELSELYGYLSKQFTIFGQHVHIGCPDADTALLTLHRMSRYIPHFIGPCRPKAAQPGRQNLRGQPENQSASDHHALRIFLLPQAAARRPRRGTRHPETAQRPAG